MCRNIKSLYNYNPPATKDDVREAALQFVRKVSGFRHPSKANTAQFDQAVENITHATEALLASLVTSHPPKDRLAEIERAKQRRNVYSPN